MDRKNIDKKYRQMILKDKNKYYKDYIKTIEKVKKSKATYKDEIVPFLYMPKFYTQIDLDIFESLTNKMISILNKVINKYLEDKEYREKFNFPYWLQQLILLPNQYESNFPMARFDIFYDYNKNFKFCEINTDGTSAMNEEKELSNIFSNTLCIENMKKNYSITPFELFDTWVNETLNIYWENNDNPEPSIAIVDFVGKASMDEFIEFRDRFRAKGLWCEIVSPDKLKTNEGYIYFNDKKIDIVYRRLVTKDLIDNIEKIEGFIEGIKSGKTTIIGPIKSQIIHNKIIFKVLYDKETKSFLTYDEMDFIEKHIPYTKELNLDKLDINNVLDNREKFIIKPMDFYASKGVFTGQECSKEKWKEILIQYDKKNYLIQEYCNPPETDMINFANKHNIIDTFKNITGLYVYNENFYGIYSRVGKKSIISSLHDGYTLPTYLIKKGN